MGTTSDKLTYLNDTKTLLRTNINAIGGDIEDDDTFRSYATQLDNMWEALPHVTGTGESLTLNTKKGKLKVDLLGNTSQDSTTGKQLLKYPYVDTSNSPKTSFGVTWVDNGDGTITANGTPTGASLFELSNRTTFKQEVQPNTEYTLSGGDTTKGVVLSFSEYDANGNVLVSHDNVTTKAFTTNASTTLLAGALKRYSNNITINNFTIKPMLELGSTAHDFEKYSGGTASPNPDYPQDIHIVSGDNTITSCSRNLGNPNTLFDEMYNSGYTNPPTRTIVDNRNVINFSTYYSHNKPLYVTKYKENTQYTFRLVAKAVESTLRYLYIVIDYTDGTKSSASIPNQGTSWDELRIVSTENKTIKDFMFSYSNAGYWYIDEDSFNIIEGDTTDYETYQGTDYNVNLPVENLLQTDTIDFNASTYNLTLGKAINSGTYILSGANITATSGQFVLYGIDENSTQDTLLANKSWASIKNGYSFTTTKKYVSLKMYTNTAVKGNLQLEYGDKANSYTPYNTTPIELNKIGTYQDRFIRNKGKNLFDKDNANILNASMSVVSGGTYMMSQSANAKSLYIPCKPNTTYTMSKVLSARCWMGTSSDTPTTSSTLLNGTFNNGATSLTLTTPSNGHYLVVYYFLNGTDTLTEQAILNSIQIEEGSSATSYEPYGNGDWYLRKNIGKVVLDGSETWAASGNNTNTQRYSTSVSSLNIMSSTNGYCNSNKFVASGVSNDEELVGINSGTLYYRIRQGILSEYSSTKFKEWASNNNIICYVPLITPTYTKIEGTLKEQLEEGWRANSYDTQTNISQVNNDLPFELNVKGLAAEETE